MKQVLRRVVTALQTAVSGLEVVSLRRVFVLYHLHLQGASFLCAITSTASCASVCFVIGIRTLCIISKDLL